MAPYKDNLMALDALDANTLIKQLGAIEQRLRYETTYLEYDWRRHRECFSASISHLKGSFVGRRRWSVAALRARLLGLPFRRLQYSYRHTRRYTRSQHGKAYFQACTYILARAR